MIFYRNNLTCNNISDIVAFVINIFYFSGGKSESVNEFLNIKTAEINIFVDPVH